MSIGEIRPCTTFAPRIDLSKYKKDPIANTVSAKTTLKEFIKLEARIRSLGLTLTQGDRFGATLLSQAAYWKKPELVEYICQKDGCRLAGLGNYKGATALHEVCRQAWGDKTKNPSILYTLMRFGAPLNIATNKLWFDVRPGTTPLDIALTYGDEESACLLKFNGAIKHRYLFETTEIDAYVKKKQDDALYLSKKITQLNIFDAFDISCPVVDIIGCYAVDPVFIKDKA